MDFYVVSQKRKERKEKNITFYIRRTIAREELKYIIRNYYELQRKFSFHRLKQKAGVYSGSSRPDCFGEEEEKKKKRSKEREESMGGGGGGGGRERLLVVVSRANRFILCEAKLIERSTLPFATRSLLIIYIFFFFPLKISWNVVQQYIVTTQQWGRKRRERKKIYRSINIFVFLPVLLVLLCSIYTILYIYMYNATIMSIYTCSRIFDKFWSSWLENREKRESLYDFSSGFSVNISLFFVKIVSNERTGGGKEEGGLRGRARETLEHFQHAYRRRENYWPWEPSGNSTLAICSPKEIS